MIRQLTSAIVALDEQSALDLTRKILMESEDPWEIMDACREAMSIIGGKFERGESFVPELIFAGEILEQINALVKPRLDHGEPRDHLGKIVFGTVQGDIHDIAKDIVIFMLDINGFEVVDLGVDVPPETFVEKILEVDAEILGLSGFLTLAFDPMKETVDLVKQQGLDNKVKVMIGGGPVDEQACQYIGADGWGKDAMAAVELARAWTIS
jgi:5-methyltetrahydrofolate--homocysteine methyltransferase